ncbi:diguanylate cyclase [Christensenellaceae bacterium OttesenSCG-928-K19]|nr:diguanylate cyclase [Christensenellaceae bacterium OttesenSCG-928-K19]
MQAEVGYGNSPDSTIAGRQAAGQALSNAGRKDPCDLVFLFCTARHNQEVLRSAVAQTVGDACPIYGGGAVGVITNENFGYAGDQVGVACIWLDEDECTLLMEDGLLESEYDTGVRLGKQLATAGIQKDSPVLLFYDAVDQTQDQMRLLMATWILDGIEKGLGFLPDLTGAGLQGDHICTPTLLYAGDNTASHCAFALKLSDNICVDHVIMHGCRPASPYYTVTKADGPTILEINGQPALTFMDSLLGPALKPDDYPFFLLFGINHSGHWDEFDEDNYASRLCLGIDKERRGIIMFEPDMVAGTKFQIMCRSLKLDYMKPKIQKLFDKLDGHDPFFAIYIDCAGRCAGYGGVELEDAYVIQDAVNGRVPLLGLYTGVEIASIGGRPRGLDWTGVFCIFSKSASDGHTQRACRRAQPLHTEENLPATEAALTPDGLEKLNEHNVSKILALDARSIAIRHELEQKRHGFALLAELAISLRSGNSNTNIFHMATQRINAALNMQKTIVLIPSADEAFVPTVLQGYSSEEKAGLAGSQINIDEELLHIEKPVLVTAVDPPDRFAGLRNTLKLPYFISTPVVIENKVSAILITGRMMEAPPFLSRLTQNDMETVQAISILLGSVLMHQRLDDANRLAQTDALTGLFNRRALEWQVAELLRQNLTYDKMSAFIMIDIDYFKSVNDKYGHIVGDQTLKKLAKMLRNKFRATDLIARLGGDEFAMFCTLTTDVAPLVAKVEKLLSKWHDSPLKASKGKSFHSSLSIGISVAPRDGTSYQDLLHRADIALYKSKQNGRNQYTVYDAKTMPK